MLRENSHWQVGNGADISIFSDHWIPEIGKPTCGSRAETEAVVVSELILQNNR